MILVFFYIQYILPLLQFYATKNRLISWGLRCLIVSWFMDHIFTMGVENFDRNLLFQKKRIKLYAKWFVSRFSLNFDDYRTPLFKLNF